MCKGGCNGQVRQVHLEVHQGRFEIDLGTTRLEGQWQFGFSELGNAANIPTRYPRDHSKLGIQFR